MKLSMDIVLLACLAGMSTASVNIKFGDHPIQRVVKLIQDLKAKVETDGKAEQDSFNEYACWCEKTLERKASDISSAKELIEETQILIEKLKGEIASHGAEITQLNKDVAQNLAAQKEAAGVRSKDHAEYAADRSESEQCIGALEAATGALTGAGAKKGFLETGAHEAQLLSVAAQVRSVFQTKSMPHSVSESDIEIVKRFVAKPEEFFKQQSHALSATQVGQNPFGDYAPQSTQIQGILKGMYDAFTSDLEKDNAQEAESQKSFEELMATKKEEAATLQDTLEKQETDQASKTKNLKESQVLKDDTVAQLEADEAFFADTTDACKSKAKEWSIRTRLRTEELQGMAQAVTILSSGDAKDTFKSSAETFLQLSSIQEHKVIKKDTSKTYGQLRKLATWYRSLGLAKIAAAVQVGGHFDKVMGMIDDMMALLRKEEAEDIVHRDLCEGSLNANKNEMADLEHQIKKAGEMITRLTNTKKELDSEIVSIKDDISGTEKSQTDLLDFRNKESTDFKQSVKDDTDAVALIGQAIGALSKFYKKNKIPLELAQRAPEYAKDQDEAPETSWSSSDYGGRKSESGGILAILAMLAEDTEKEIADARGDDADAQAKYEKQNGALQNTLDAQEDTKVTLEEEKASTEEKIDAAEAFKTGQEKDHGAEGDTAKALGTDCAWVDTHFKTRRDKRKDEMQGLVDAKAFLAGVESGDDPMAPTI